MPSTSLFELPDTFVDVASDPPVRLALRVLGPEEGPRLLLVHGLGAQIVSWEPGFVELLAERGLRVATFDNRDIGASTHLDDLGVVNLQQVLAGDRSSLGYEMSDLAADGFAVMDHLGWERAHVAGRSMGGMVVQQMAISAPERVASLTSIMSTPHATVGRGTAEAIAILSRAPAGSREENAAATISANRVFGSTTHPRSDEELAAKANREWDRAFDPAGVGRQMGATQAAPDRREALGDLDVPTLVIHGTEDTLIQPEGGVETAEAVPGARLELVEGMGHDLPTPLHDDFVEMIVEHVTSAETG